MIDRNDIIDWFYDKDDGQRMSLKKMLFIAFVGPPVAGFGFTFLVWVFKNITDLIYYATMYCFDNEVIAIVSMISIFLSLICGIIAVCVYFFDLD